MHNQQGVDTASPCLLTPPGIFRIACAALILALTVSPAQQDEGRAYFSVSTNRSYAPGERASVQLWADGISQLQFRLYKVRDPVAFFRQLEDPHRFGGQGPRRA